jgi:hypothetical protein
MRVPNYIKSVAAPPPPAQYHLPIGLYFDRRLVLIGHDGYEKCRFCTGCPFPSKKNYNQKNHRGRIHAFILIVSLSEAFGQLGKLSFRNEPIICICTYLCDVYIYTRKNLSRKDIHIIHASQIQGHSSAWIFSSKA